jgi:glucose-1-phosphate adenylyltransferase
VLSPGVVVEAGAVVRDSVLFNNVRVESGAVVERSILDKEVIVGWGARIGAGSELNPNVERPELLWSGVNVVGKRAHIPHRFEIMRNTVIGPLVHEELMDSMSLPVGATVRSSRTGDPLFL